MEQKLTWQQTALYDRKPEKVQHPPRNVARPHPGRPARRGRTVVEKLSSGPQKEDAEETAHSPSSPREINLVGRSCRLLSRLSSAEPVTTADA